MGRRAGLAVVGLLAFGVGVVVAPPGGSAPGLAAAPPMQVDADCALDWAVYSLSIEASAGGCTFVAGMDTIQIGAANTARWAGETGPGVNAQLFPGDDTYAPVGRSMTIEGIGPEPVGIFPGSPYRGGRLFSTAPGVELTLRNLTIGGFWVQGTPSTPDTQFIDDGQPAGDARGGAIYAEGPLIIERVVFVGNSARGGVSSYDPSVPASRATALSGGAASGGAIYATADVTISDSVFVDNSAVGGSGVTAPAHPLSTPVLPPFGDSTIWIECDPRCGPITSRDGGSGGDAMGADIAMGDRTNLDVTNTLFDSSQVIGGNGSYGFTSDDVKNLIKPKAENGRDGYCDPLDESAADGTNGYDGDRGQPGGRGGDAGDAIGTISGDKVRLDGVTFTGTRAFAGGAGQEGMAGQGEIGGDAGDAVLGECYWPSDDPFNPFDLEINWTGDPGHPGWPGWQGKPGRPGDRAVAVGVVQAGTVLMSNVTVTGIHVEVPPDIVDPDFPNREAARDLIMSTNDEYGAWALDRHGEEVVRGWDSRGLPTRGFAADPEPYEQAGSPGRSVVLNDAESSDSFISHSSFVTINVIGALPGRRITPTTRHLMTQRSHLRANVFQQIPAVECNNVLSSGHNRFSATCTNSPIGTLLDSDRSFNIGARLEETPSYGPPIVADWFGEVWRLPTHAPFVANNPDGDLVDRFAAPCVDVLGAVVTVDARGAVRDALCDVGAHELRPVDASLEIRVPGNTEPVDSAIATQPLDELWGEREIRAQLIDPTLTSGIGDVGARLIVDVDVEIGGSIVPYAGLIDFGDGRGPVAETSVAYDLPTTTSAAAISETLRFAPTNPVGSLRLRASIDPGVGALSEESVADTEVLIPFDFDTSQVFEFAPVGNLSRCRTGALFTYTTRPTGVSRVLARDVLVAPNRLAWSIPALTSTAQEETFFDVFVPASLPNGAVVVPAIYTTGGDPIVEFTADAVTVLPTSVFDVAVEGLDGIVPGETRDATVRVSNLGDRRCNDVVGVTLEVTTDADPSFVTGQAVPDWSMINGGTWEFTVPYTAPAVTGPVDFRWRLTMPGSDLIAPIRGTDSVDVVDPTTSTTTTTTTVPSGGTTTTTTTVPSGGTTTTTTVPSGGTTTTLPTDSPSGGVLTINVPNPGPTVQAEPGKATAVVFYEVTVGSPRSLADRTASPEAVSGPTLVCTPASGSAFAIGRTVVDCAASDAQGNTGSASFVVTVIDDQPPVVADPPDQVIPTGGSFSPPTGGDNSGAVTVECDPSPETVLPLGPTTVNCTATDPSGNTTMASFVVTVSNSIGTLPPTGGGGPVRLSLLIVAVGLALVTLSRTRQLDRPGLLSGSHGDDDR